MVLESQIVWSMMTYKLASLGVGLCSLYMGYRLFMSGVWGQAGDVDVKFQDNHLLIKRGAPGTFFAILGTIIVCATLVKGLDFDASSNAGSTPQVEHRTHVPLPEKPPF